MIFHFFSFLWIPLNCLHLLHKVYCDLEESSKWHQWLMHQWLNAQSVSDGPWSPLLPLVPPSCLVHHFSSVGPISLHPTTRACFTVTSTHSKPTPTANPMPEGEVTTLPFQSLGENVVFRLRRKLNRDRNKQAREQADIVSSQFHSHGVRDLHPANSSLST